MDTGLFLHAGVIRKVCQALWSPQQLFVLNAKNASALKYQPVRSFSTDLLQLPGSENGSLVLCRWTPFYF